MGRFFVDEYVKSHSADSSRTHWKPTVIVLPVLRPFFLGYLRQGVGVVGSNLYAATFLRVRGTMSGNESSCHKCPVLERLGSTTLFSCDTTPDISYSIAPASRVLFFIPSSNKMAGLRALAFATGGVVLCFDSSCGKPFDLTALFYQSVSFLLSFWHLGRKSGTLQHSPFSRGGVVIGQLFWGLPVKCKWCVARTGSCVCGLHCLQAVRAILTRCKQELIPLPWSRNCSLIGCSKQ